MTVQELVDYCNREGISLDTQIALSAKDDYFLTEEKIYIDDSPYFGNCADGQEWLDNNVSKDEDDEIDWEKVPSFLVLNTGRG